MTSYGDYRQTFDLVGATSHEPNRASVAPTGAAGSVNLKGA
jgi:hypothetical protein